jgi:hypothetical protein
VSDWSWQEEFRSSPPRLTGDPDAARAFPIWTPQMPLERFAHLISLASPGPEPVEVKFTVAGDQLKVEIASDTCDLTQRFTYLDGELEVVFDLYAIADSYQNSGHARRMLKNALIAYDALDVRLIVAHANSGEHADLGAGGYVWATLGAQSVDWPIVKQELLDRLPGVARAERFSRTEARDLENLIYSPPSPRLMYDIARTTNARGKQLGRPLLLGYSWIAFWNINDPVQRQLIEEAFENDPPIAP